MYCVRLGRGDVGTGMKECVGVSVLGSLALFFPLAQFQRFGQKSAPHTKSDILTWRGGGRLKC